MEAAEESSSDLPEKTAREVDRLREELRLCRMELAKARQEMESALESQARVRRSKVRAENESQVLAKALSDVLFRQARDRVRAGWWRVGGGPRPSRHEWEQVQILRQSRFFRPAWYLRENLDIARQGMEPALHFLRKGYREGRDPAPNFSVTRYLAKHPELRRSRTNPLIHALETGDVPVAKKKKKSTS